MIVSNQEINSNALIVGASQGIGLGFVKELLKRQDFSHIYATYRSQESARELLNLAQIYPLQLTSLQVDLTEESQLIEKVELIKSQITQLHLVINCVGILHEKGLQPEKSLRQINTDKLLQYFQINSIGSLLLAKHLLPLLRHDRPSILATISAKLGSIGDNRLGGWYGYRASKAALNMFMRTVAIEYARTTPKTIVVMLHPGTTDTRLSKPFQKNVPPEKLFSVERTVNQLLSVIANLTETDTGQFFSWDGTRLPW